MRTIAGLLIIFSLVFGLAGLFFGRAAWIGKNTRSIPIWVLLEVLTIALLIFGIATHIRVSWTLPLRYLRADGH